MKEQNVNYYELEEATRQAAQTSEGSQTPQSAHVHGKEPDSHFGFILIECCYVPQRS